MFLTSALQALFGHQNPQNHPSGNPNLGGSYLQKYQFQAQNSFISSHDNSHNIIYKNIISFFNMYIHVCELRSA